MQGFIKMNVALAGFLQGQQWSYDKAPDVVKMWLKNNCILFETQICSFVKEKTIENIQKISKQKQAEIDKLFQTINEEKKEILPKSIKQKRGRPKGSGRKKTKK